MSKTKTFSVGGIHPDKHKNTSYLPIEDAGIPETVYVPVKQHIGAPAKILVKKGDRVKVGTMIADADGIVSADVHSPVSGEVIKVEEVTGEVGYLEKMITIRTEGDEWEETIDRTPDLVKDITASPEEIVSIIRNTGIVGMGGAGYPTPIKVTLPAGKKIDCIILNGIECEPYLTADDRLMQEKAEQIIIGAKILNRALGIQKAVIAIDENKPAAIEVMHRLTRRYVGVNVVVCKTKYPQGKDIVVSGGVASNTYLRRKLQELADLEGLAFSAPPIKFCTDNGVMIAWAGMERALKGMYNDLDFKPRPRWPLDENAPKAAGAGGVKA